MWESESYQIVIAMEQSLLFRHTWTNPRNKGTTTNFPSEHRDLDLNLTFFGLGLTIRTTRFLGELLKNLAQNLGGHPYSPDDFSSLAFENRPTSRWSSSLISPCRCSKRTWSKSRSNCRRNGSSSSRWNSWLRRPGKPSSIHWFTFFPINWGLYTVLLNGGRWRFLRHQFLTNPKWWVFRTWWMGWASFLGYRLHKICDFLCQRFSIHGSTSFWSISSYFLGWNYTRSLNTSWTCWTQTWSRHMSCITSFQY